MNKKLDEQRVREVILEEYFNTMLEDVASGKMDADDFSSNMQQAAAGIPKVFNALFNTFAKKINNYVNKDLLPRAMGQKIKSAMDNVSSPEEFSKEDSKEQADSIEDLDKIIDAATSAVAQSGNKEEAGDLKKLGDKADELEKKADSQGEDSSGEDIGDVEPKVKSAVLDLIDATNEKWDAISKATKNKKLKAAMDTMEKVALSEELYQRILQKIKENKE